MKRKCQLKIMLLFCLVFICSLCIFKKNEAKELNLPFTFENTTYGIKNNQVTAKELKITRDNTYIENIIDDALIVIREEFENGKYDNIYIVGNKGYITGFSVLKTDDNWRSKFSSVWGHYTVSGISLLVDDVEYKYNMSWGGRYKNIKDDNMHMLYIIKNPLTNKYDIIDATDCKYYEYGFDRFDDYDSTVPENGEYIIKVEKDGKLGLYNCYKRELIYNCLFDEIDIGAYTARGVKKYVDKEESTKYKYTLLTYNGNASENIEYDSVDKYSGNAIALEDESKISICEIESKDTQKLYVYNENGRLLKSFSCKKEYYLKSDYFVLKDNAYINICQNKKFKNTYDGGKIIQYNDYSVCNAYIINEDSIIDVNARYGGEFSEIYANKGSEYGTVVAHIYEGRQQAGKFVPDGYFYEYDNSVEWYLYYTKDIYYNHNNKEIVSQSIDVDMYDDRNIYTCVTLNNGCYIKRTSKIVAGYNAYDFDLFDKSDKFVRNLETESKEYFMDVKSISDNIIAVNDKIIDCSTNTVLVKNASKLYMCNIDPCYNASFEDAPWSNELRFVSVDYEAKPDIIIIEGDYDENGNNSKIGVLNLKTNVFSGYIFEADEWDNNCTVNKLSNGKYLFSINGKYYDDRFKEKTFPEAKGIGNINIQKDQIIVINSKCFTYYDNDFNYKNQINIRYSDEVIYSCSNLNRTYIFQDLYPVLTKDITDPDDWEQKCYAYADIYGNELTNYKYIEVSNMVNGLAVARYKDSYEYCIINSKGEEIVCNDLRRSFFRYKHSNIQELENIGNGFYISGGYDNNDPVYFYNMTALQKNPTVGELSLEKTIPESGKSDVSLDDKNIHLIFNRAVNIFDGDGNIKICDYDTGKVVLSYNILGGSKIGQVIYASGSKKDIILQNALTTLEEGKKYYVTIDGRCFSENIDDVFEKKWFEGVTDKNQICFTMEQQISSEFNEMSSIAACELQQFNISTDINKSIYDYLHTGKFTDKKIWKNIDIKYSQLFNNYLGKYKIISVIEPDNTTLGYTLLVDSENKKAIFVISSNTKLPENYSSISEKIMLDYFNASNTIYKNLINDYSDYEIAITGEGFSGMVASYISIINNKKSYVFNTLSHIGMDIAFAKGYAAIKEFNGVENIKCINYYNENLPLKFGESENIYESYEVKNNSVSGDCTKLNAIYQYDGKFSIMAAISGTKTNQLSARRILSMQDVYKIGKKFLTKNILSGFYGVLSGGNCLIVGTNKRDFSSEINVLPPIIIYSGGNSENEYEKLYGGWNSNIFCYTGGNSELVGSCSQDLYLINGNSGNVIINDSTSNLYTLTQFKEVYEYLTPEIDDKMDKILGEIKIVSDAETLINTLKKGNDTVILNNSEINTEMIKISGNYYLINSGNCTVKILKNRMTPIEIYGRNDTGVMIQDGKFITIWGKDTQNEQTNLYSNSINQEVVLSDNSEVVSTSDIDLKNLFINGKNMTIELYDSNNSLCSTIDSNLGSSFSEMYWMDTSDESTVIYVNNSVKKIKIKGGSIFGLECKSIVDLEKIYKYDNLINADIEINIDNQTVNKINGSSTIAVSNTIKDNTIVSGTELMDIIIEKPTKTVYEFGEVLDKSGMKVTAYYSDGSTKEISDYSINELTDEIGKQTIKVEYGNIIKMFDVYVYEKNTVVSNINIQNMSIVLGEYKQIDILTNLGEINLDEFIIESEDNSIAVVKSGFVQGLKMGTTYINITNIKSGISSRFMVTVNKQNISIKTSMNKKSFKTKNEGYKIASADNAVITITNTGNQVVNILKSNLKNFVVSDFSKNSLSPGENASFTIQPKTGLCEGRYNETLVVKTTSNINTSINVDFKVNKAFGLKINPLSATVFKGNSQKLSAIPTGGSGNYTYKWYKGNETTVIGSTKDIIVSPNETTIYKVVVNDTIDSKSIVSTITVKPKTYTITASNSICDFGKKSEGYSVPSSKTITIKNTGNQAITMNKIVSASFNVSNLSKSTLEPGETATFKVSPKNSLSAKTYNEKLVIKTTMGTSTTVNLKFMVCEISAPTNAKAVSASYNKIKISWKKVGYITGYEIYQYNKYTKKYIKIKTTSGSFYTHTGLITGSTYKYKIRTYKIVNGKTYYSKYTNEISAKPLLNNVTGFKASNYKSKTASLRWNKVYGASGYTVYRSTKRDSGFKILTTLNSSNTIKYSNNYLQKGKIYYYKIKAYRIINGKKVFSSYSTTLKVTIKK